MENNHTSSDLEFNMHEIKFNIRPKAGVWHVEASSLVDVQGVPMAEAKCLVGESGEVLVAPVDYVQAAFGMTATSAHGYVSKNLGANSIVAYPYAEKSDGSPDWHCRRKYIEAHCLRKVILDDAARPEVLKHAHTPFLKRLAETLREIDAKGIPDTIAPGQLRTPYALAYQGKRIKEGCEPAPKKEHVAKIKEQVAESATAVPAQAADADATIAAATTMSELLLTVNPTNKLVGAVGRFLQARDNTKAGSPVEHIAGVVLAWGELKAAVAAFAKEVPGC